MDSIFFINFTNEVKNCVNFKYNFIKSRLIEADWMLKLRSRFGSTFFKSKSIGLFPLFYLIFCFGILFNSIFDQQVYLKGSNMFQYEFMSPIFSLGVIIFFPIAGKLMFYVPVKLLLFAGSFVSGVSCIFFEVLKWTLNYFFSVHLAFFLKLFQGFGSAIILTCSYSFIISSDLNEIGRNFALAETAFAFGLIIAPIFAALLCQFGGFSFPFFIFGSMTLIGSVLILFMDTQKDLYKFKYFNFWPIIKQLDISLCLVTFLSAFLLLGFNETGLVYYFQNFILFKPASLGLLLLLTGASYHLNYYFWAYLLDIFYNAQHLSIIGFVIEFVALTITGSLHKGYFLSSLEEVIVGQILIGFALKAKIMGSFIQTLRETFKFGFTDNITTYSMIANALTYALCLGFSLGLAIGDFVVPRFGIKTGSWVVITVHLVICVLIIIKMFIKYLFHNKLIKSITPNVTSKKTDQTNGLWAENQENKYASLCYIYSLNEDLIKTSL